MIQRYKVFVSYHHGNDQSYRDAFERMFAGYYNIFISKSVQIGDINPYLPADTIRQKIRDEYLRDSTVTVVLVGTETWKRKHVDWEIGSSIRQTLHSSRSGLLGILLPTHPSYGGNTYDPGIVPPRLVDNQRCGYAQIYHWNNNSTAVASWTERAFVDRAKLSPDNSYPHFVNNKYVQRWQ